ncbi:MAG: hypothetical protein K2X77_09250 [Candidatus Obscuribacterales bacterium]|jgi:hypothetical protein|nr:hypothetical protein [Candidatus Obscuribacterales bacterium]
MRQRTEEILLRTSHGLGYEYKLRIDELDAERATSVIRSAPSFADFDSTNELFNFRGPEIKSQWPTLVAKIDSDGIYLCHYGDAKLFDLVVAYLNANLNKVPENFVVEEL